MTQLYIAILILNAATGAQEAVDKIVGPTTLEKCQLRVIEMTNVAVSWQLSGQIPLGRIDGICRPVDLGAIS